MSARAAATTALLACAVLGPAACATRDRPPAPPRPPAAPQPPPPVSMPAPPAPVSVPAPTPQPPPPTGAIDCPVKRQWTARLLARRGPFRVELRECPSSDPLKLPRQQVALWQPGVLQLAWGIHNEAAGDDSPFLIEDVKTLDLDRDGQQELLILMRHEGTGAYLEWCLLGAEGSGIGCWDAPDLEGPATKLLRADEDFGFLGWQLRVLPRALRLERSVYHKGVDPNCCPTRGTVVATLVPRTSTLELQRIVREPAKPGAR